MIRKVSSAAAALLVSATFLMGQVPVGLAPFSTFLKANSSVLQVKTDAEGFIYVYGVTATSGSDPEDAGYNQELFVLRLNPSATAVTYTVYLGGSSPTYGGAMTVDPAGNAYVTGYTDASDFPTVPHAPGPTTVNAQFPFVTKIASSGMIVYSTFFSNGAGANPQSIAVDGSGDAIVSGGGSGTGFPTTAGAYVNEWNSYPPFITKLDPTGTKLAFSSVGVGGSSLAFDGSGNIFVAGTSFPASPNPAPYYPTTPGAFQTTYTPYFYCGGPPCFSEGSAGEQYVSKLSADGSTLVGSTFVTGSLGAYNAGMAIDASGNIWLTGDTPSTDYPYTQGKVGSDTFTTELDPTLSKVLLSVPQGVPPGNGSNLAIDAQGNLIEAGTFAPGQGTLAPWTPVPVPPAPDNTPAQCLPGGAGAWIARIASQDGSVLGTRFLPVGTPAQYVLASVSSTVDAQGNVYVGGASGMPDVPLTPGVVYDPAVSQPTVSGAFLERTNFSVAASPVGCVTDATSMILLGPAAPGQLITLYGNGIGPSQPVVGLIGGGSGVPTSLGGVSVTFDGQPAPILYASATQVNVQVPFEVKENPSTTMQAIYNGSVLETRTFAVVAQNPSLFVASALTGLTCANLQIGSPVLGALALNEDGSVNSCTNPAAAGSSFTLFVNGIGTAAGNRYTGQFTGANPGFDAVTAAVFDGEYSVEVDAFTDQPEAISGIGQIVARVPETIAWPQPMNVTLTLNGVQAGPLGAHNGVGASASQIPVLVFVKP